MVCGKGASLLQKILLKMSHNKCGIWNGGSRILSQLISNEGLAQC